MEHASKSNDRKCSFETTAARAGITQLDRVGDAPAVIPTVRPIYMSTTFVAQTIGGMDRVFGNEEPGYVYTRYANPSLAELERTVALLEGGEPENTVAFASGMAALHSTMLASGLSAGDRVVASRDLYGQTYTLLNVQMRRLGIETTFIDATNLDEVTSAIERQRPRLVMLETVSNPLLRVALVPQIAEAAHRAGALVSVDNTFATPYLVNPLAYGADIVVHSATKYLSGHGDTMGGVVIASTSGLATELRRVRRDTGAVLSPHDAWLITRGLRTLTLRVQRQCENALQIANWLKSHPAISHVNYPGFEPKPLKNLYGVDLGGGMVSFVIRDAGRDEVFAFMERLQLILPATTLGDLATLILYPVMSSHRSLSPEARREIGISDDLVRLSVGIESIVDIISDLDNALKG